MAKVDRGYRFYVKKEDACSLFEFPRLAEENGMLFVLYEIPVSKEKTSGQSSSVYLYLVLPGGLITTNCHAA